MLINLLYHDVISDGNDDQSGFPGPEAARYKLNVDDFEYHLERIAEVVTHPPLATTDLYVNDLASAESWMITFDDGGLSASTEIAGLLEEHGWRGWFFIATDFLNQPCFCTNQQIKQLSERGHVIGSHSCSHPERISSCSWNQMLDEWTRSCRILADLIEKPIITASVPGGFYSQEVAEAAAEAGIRILFNSEPTTSTNFVAGMTVLGRYNIYRGMSAGDALSLLTDSSRRWRQSAFWNVKKVAKRFVGPLYKMVRHTVLTQKYPGGKPNQSGR